MTEINYWREGVKLHYSNPKEAIKQYQKALETLEHPFIYTNIAQCYHKLNDQIKAFEYFTRAHPLLLNLDNRYDAAPYNSCAWAFYENNMLEDALDLITIALEIDSGDLFSLDTHAKILIKLNQTQKAIISLAKIEHLNPEFEDAQDLLKKYQNDIFEYIQDYRDSLNIAELVDQLFFKYDQNSYNNQWHKILKDLYGNFLPLDDPWMLRGYSHILAGQTPQQLFVFFENNLSKRKFKQIPQLLQSCDIDDAQMIKQMVHIFTKSNLNEALSYWMNAPEKLEQIIHLLKGRELETIGEIILEKNDHHKINLILKRLQNDQDFSNPLPLIKSLKDRDKAQDIYIDHIKKWFYNRGARIQNGLIDQICNYIKDGGSFDELKGNLIALWHTEQRFKFYDVFLSNQLNDPFFQRAVQIGTIIDPDTMFEYYFKITTLTQDQFSDLIIQYDLSIEQLATHFIKRIHNNNQLKTDQFKKLLHVLLQYNYKTVVDTIKKGKPNSVATALETIWNFDQIKRVDTLTHYATELNSKQIQQEVMIHLSNHQPAYEKIKELTSHKKAPVRAFFTTLLSTFRKTEDIEYLKDKLNTEKAKSVRSIIDDIIINDMIIKENPVPIIQNLDSLKGDFQKKSLRYVIKGSKEPVSGIKSLDIQTITPPVWADTETALTSEECYALIDLFAQKKEVVLNPEGNHLKNLMIPESLELFVKIILDRWNKEAKSKWILALIATLGSKKIITQLLNQMRAFIGRNRGAMAAHTVTAIALINTPIAIQTIYKISRKERQKQVRESGIKALDMMAKKLNITKDQLLDQTISDFGLSSTGTLKLNYGSRQFLMTLQSDLNFIIFNQETDKIVKNLPKPGKKDDLILAKSAKEQFKTLKKGIKDQIKLQIERLDEGIGRERRWCIKQWEKIFMDNPTMRSLTIALIWGVYQENKLISIMRYQEDGTFCDAQYNEIKLPKNSKISLIHPLNFSKNEISLWLEQLSDEEIEQPFPQLERPIFKIRKEQENQTELLDFQGYMITKITLKQKLFSRGWYYQLGYEYDQFMKEIPEEHLKVILTTHSDDFSGFRDINEIPVYKVLFFLKGNPCKIAQIPPVIYSECYNELKIVIDSGSGFNPDWKND